MKTAFYKTATETQRSHGQRRRYKGRMVAPGGSPRGHTHGGHSPARAGWTCGEPMAAATKSGALGPYRVQMPRNRVRYGGAFV